MFETNVGTVDRIARFVIGIILLGIGIYLISNGTTTIGYILSGISIIPFATSLMSTCPIYSMLGISTGESKV